MYLNGKLIDTITTTPTNWKINSNLVYLNIGANTISLIDNSNNKDIALSNIQFYYALPPTGPLTLTYNS